MPKGSSDGGAGGAFRFRVSDVLDVPLRGHLLRLKLLDGRPALADVKPGRHIRLRSPDSPEGGGRTAKVEDLSTTGGKPTPERLETKGELDIIVSDEAALGDADPVRIGWFVEGPLDS